MEVHPAVHFFDDLEEEEYISFLERGGVLAIQKLKTSFVCNLFGWAKLYIGEELLSLIGFLECLASI